MLAVAQWTTCQGEGFQLACDPTHQLILCDIQFNKSPGGGFKPFSNFYPYLGKIPILRKNMFQRG